MLTLIATLAFAATPLTVVVPTLRAPELPEQELTYQSGLFAAQLRRAGVKVVTGAAVEGAMGAPALASLSACEAPPCTALGELAKRLDADAVLLGEVARSGVGFQAEVRGFKAPDGALVVRRSAAAHSPEELTQMLSVLARDAALELFSRTGKEPVPQPPEPLPQAPDEPMSTVPGAAVAISGVVVAAVSITLSSIARGQLTDVRSGFELQSYAAAVARANSARTLSVVSAVGIGVGIAALAIGTVRAVVAVRSNPNLVVVAPYLDGHSGGFAFSGVWP